MKSEIERGFEELRAAAQKLDELEAPGLDDVLERFWPREKVEQPPSFLTCESNDCKACKGAASQYVEHYALGRLRLLIGRQLGYAREVTMQLDLRTLLDRRMASIRATA